LKLFALVLPSLVAVAAGLTGGLVQRRMRPQFSAPVLAGLAVTASAGVLLAIGLVAFGWAGWCRALYSHDEVPAWLGLPALVGLPILVAAGLRASRRWKASLVRRHHSGHELEVIDTDEPIAYAVPGAPGHIVVSVGMLTRLRSDERLVLLAHERSHLQRRHHRYLWLVEVASAVVPVLRPMRVQVRFATERWADEDAASQVGDRRLVARAISRAALAQSDHTSEPALALVGPGVAARVEAMISGGPSRQAACAALGATALAGWVAIAGSAMQSERLWTFVRHICRS